MFEYYGDIHVYCPGIGAYERLGSIFFRMIFLIFSPTDLFLQDFYFKCHFKSFSHSDVIGHLC